MLTHLLTLESCRQRSPTHLVKQSSSGTACSCDLQEAIRLWEELRQQETPAARRLELVTSILGLIKGHMGNMAASPTASRIIQSCVKHGSPAHRAQVHAPPHPSTPIVHAACDRDLCVQPHGLHCSHSNAASVQVLEDIRPQLVELAQNPYAHFLISKLLTKATRADAAGQIRASVGVIVGLLTLLVCRI